MTKGKKIFRLVVVLLWAIASAIIFLCVKDEAARQEALGMAYGFASLPFVFVGLKFGWRLTGLLRAFGRGYGTSTMIGAMYLISGIIALIAMEFSLPIAFLQALFVRARPSTEAFEEEVEDEE